MISFVALIHPRPRNVRLEGYKGASPGYWKPLFPHSRPHGLRDGDAHGEASTHAGGQAVFASGTISSAVRQVVSEVVSEVVSTALQSFQIIWVHPEPGCSSPLNSTDGGHANCSMICKRQRLWGQGGIVGMGDILACSVAKSDCCKGLSELWGLGSNCPSVSLLAGDRSGPSGVINSLGLGADRQDLSVLSETHNRPV